MDSEKWEQPVFSIHLRERRTFTACLTECGVLVYLCRTWSSGGWALGEGPGWAAENRGGVRKKEDISLELVSVGRGRAAFQLA